MASCGVSLRGGRRRTATAPPRSKASHATPRTCPLRRSPWQLGLNHAATAVRGTQRGLGQLVAARQNAGVHPVPTQQTQGRDMQCREGGERKLLKREGRGRSCSAVVGGGVPCSDQPPAGIADSAYLSAGLSAGSSARAECSAAAQPTAEGEGRPPPERRSSHDRLPPYKTSCAVPVRQKTVRVLAEEMYPLTTNQHRSRPSPSS